MYLLSVLACAVALMTWWIHTFLGHRVVLGPMLQADFSPFARATMEVCWHITTVFLGFICIALMVATSSESLLVSQVLWLVSFALALPSTVLFWVIGKRRFGRWLVMPQWNLLGGIALTSGLAWLFPIKVSIMTGLAVALGSILLILAVVHILWALGSPWPGKSREELGRLVVGNPPGKSTPGSGLTLIVACFLGCTGGALIWTQTMGWSHPYLSGFIWFLAVLFLLRGVVGYIDPWLRPWTKNMPFKHWNQVLYSPVSLMMGMLALGLAMGGT